MVAVLFTLLLAGCPHPLWLPDRNLKEYVGEQDVLGEWKLRPESLALLTRDGFRTNPSYRYTIDFLPGGACRFRAVIDAFEGGTYYDVAGTWKLEHDTRGDSNIEKKNAIRMSLALPNTSYCYYLNFDRRNGALVLWSFYGDPDSWEFMEYTKEE